MRLCNLSGRHGAANLGPILALCHLFLVSSVAHEIPDGPHDDKTNGPENNPNKRGLDSPIFIFITICFLTFLIKRSDGVWAVGGARSKGRNRCKRNPSGRGPSVRLRASKSLPYKGRLGHPSFVRASTKGGGYGRCGPWLRGGGKLTGRLFGFVGHSGGLGI